jgi:hypothetical protein
MGDSAYERNVGWTRRGRSYNTAGCVLRSTMLGGACAQVSRGKEESDRAKELVSGNRIRARLDCIFEWHGTGPTDVRPTRPAYTIQCPDYQHGNI